MILNPYLIRTRLLALAALLAGAFFTLPSTAPPQPTYAPALLFLSPNTEDGLSLEESLRRLSTPEHARCRLLVDRIVRELAVGPGHVHDALGEWQGAVENSLLVVLPQAPDPDRLRYAAAWFGLVAEQKAVLSFRPDPRGRDVLVTLEVPGRLDDVRRRLDRHGIHDRTILIEGDVCRVFVLDERGARSAALAELARAANGRLTSLRGRGESLAGATREEARQRYQEVLRGSRLAWAASAER